MSELGDRLVILVVAATALAVFVLGWVGGLIVTEVPGWAQYAGIGLLVVLVGLILVGIWKEFDVIGR